MPACRQVPSLNDGATRSTRAKDNVLAWYLLYSKPRQEGVAVENLKRQGYETYLPLIRTRRRRQGQYVSLVEPMFPRYLLISARPSGCQRSCASATCRPRCRIA